jgi:hypothetical protein
MFASLNLVELVFFHLKVYGIPYTRTYTEFRGIPWNFAVLNGKKFCGITRNKVNSL